MNINETFVPQEFNDASAETQNLDQVQLIIIVRGTPKDPVDGYGVCYKSLLSIKQMICVHIFLEVIFLNIAAPNKTKINVILLCL